MRKSDAYNKEKNPKVPVLLKQVSAACVAVYLLLAVLFPVLAGQALYLKESKNEMKMPAAQSGTVELYAGNCIDQHFRTWIQRLESISVQWGTYYRANAGTAIIELYNMETEQILLSGTFDVSAIPEGGITTLTAEEPLEGLAGVPLMLRIYSPDSQPGSAASPLMNVETVSENTLLFFNGIEEPVQGTVCFSVKGTDYIWFGLHYRLFAALGFTLLLAVLMISRKKYVDGKASYLAGAILSVQRYKFLIRQLVSRDFKTKYKRSVLGMFWSFLNPLLTMTVQYFIFSTIFKTDIPNYAAYLLIGIVCFNFFSEASNMSLFSILGNAGLITKVYMPKYIYPVTRVLSSVVNLGISLIPLILVCLLTGVHFQKSALLALYFLVCLIIFTLGVCLVLSAAMVFFRDTQFLWSVFSMVWMYATAIFYPESILPEKYRFVLDINPLYHFIKNIRVCILNGVSPEPAVYGQCLLISLLMLLVGAWVFKKNQDKFVLYL